MHKIPRIRNFLRAQPAEKFTPPTRMKIADLAVPLHLQTLQQIAQHGPTDHQAH
jgi:hypothetical protein